MQDVIFYLFAIVSSLYVLHFGLYLIFANIYDVWQYYRQHWMRARPLYPLVTIAIAAHNEEAVVARCLASIAKTAYPNIEVIVADDASNDWTQKLVRDYALRHPTQNVRVYRMRKNVGKGRALSTVLRRYARGEFAMTLDADSLILPETVGNALTYFANPTVAGVAANVQIIDDTTVLGTLQKFEHMVGYRSKKMYSLLNCEFVVGGVASTYRMDILRKVNFYDTDTVTEDIGLSTKIVNLGNKSYRMVYGADVLAMTEGVMTLRALMRQRYRWKYGSLQNLIKYHRLIINPRSRYSRTLTMYRMPMAVISEFALLLSPVAWTYTLYMTLTQYDLTLVLGAYATITLYMLITIWFDEHLRIRSRLQLSAYATVAYFIFYIMDLVQLVAIIRCLGRSPQLLKRKDIGSTWVSPKRIGKDVAVA